MRAATTRFVDTPRGGVPSAVPDDLFEMLLDAGVNSSKALAQVAKALKEDDPFAHDDEHCPHCGGLLRRRLHVSKKALDAIAQWLEQKSR